MAAIKSGIVLMAMQAKAPIVPVYIHKKEKSGDRNCIVIGEPINTFNSDSMPSMAEINGCADAVYEKMLECKKLYEKMSEE